MKNNNLIVKCLKRKLQNLKTIFNIKLVENKQPKDKMFMHLLYREGEADANFEIEYDDYAENKQEGLTK